MIKFLVILIEENKHEERDKKFQEFWNLEVYSYELKL